MPNALIVDDEPHVRSLIKTILSHMKFSPIYEAKSGLECMDIFKQHHPCLILLDINLPGVDGREVLKMLKSQKDDTKIIMLTSNNSLNVVDECLDNGADNYILKNNSPEKIMTIIQSTYGN